MPDDEFRVQWTGTRTSKLDHLVWELTHNIVRYTDDRLVRLAFGHGGADGVDTAVDTAAKAKGIERRVWPPDWARHGIRAGILRNHTMVDEFKPHLGIGLNWDGSKGTSHCVNYLRKKGIPTLSIEYWNDPEGRVFPF